MKGVWLCLVFILQGGSTVRSQNETDDLYDLYVPKASDDVNNNGIGSIPSEQLLRNDRSQSDVRKKQFQQFAKGVHKYFYLPFDILGLFSCLITILILQRGALRSSSTVYIRGIAAANLLNKITRMFFHVKSYEILYETAAGQSVYSYYVAFIYPCTFISLAANSWTIIAFATERLIAISYPLKFYVISDESRAKKVVLGIFAVAILSNITRFFRCVVTTETDPVTNETIHAFSYTEFGRDPVHNAVLYWMYALTGVLIPIPLLAILNVLIVVKLRMNKSKQSALTEGNTRLTGNKAVNVQIERVLLGSIFSFLICKILGATVSITVAVEGTHVLRQFIFEVQLRYLMSGITNTIYPLLDFLIYVCCSTILRKSVKDLFCVCCRDPTENPGKSVTLSTSN